jgi:hypothetical protein
MTFYFASTFDAPDKESNFLIESNPLQKVMNSMSDNFPEGSNKFMDVEF